MAAQIRHIKNIWEECSTLPNCSDIQCDNCKQVFKKRGELYVEAHLFHSHNTFTTEGNFIWKAETNDSPWRYFTHERLEQKYTPNCIICGKGVRVYYKSHLDSHLDRHIKALDKTREEINRCSGLSQHFTVDTENFKTNCKHCSWFIETFDGRMHNLTQILTIHQAECPNINEHSESDGGTGHYNVDATIQQPVTTENDASTSFHNDRHERVSENQEDQQRYAGMATIRQPVTAESYASTSFHNDRHGRGSENQEDQQ
ncbi:uncharacterized protein LOC112463120, partial [Temnothorax curvispinosus]|uniref:Uncharacterized protein LOC112463120 n=1 Tax=Temnothorax curvispinosus TaxID=300111 RepID=A0A6J1QRH5_9HYME